jgi:sarcosine oxidase subunit alpha
MAKRLPQQAGEWIDRTVPVEFRFEGETFQGYRGDVLSSALWASGVRLLGRSFKYHRPRSIYTLSGYDANVIVENCTQTNLRGDLLPISAGLDVRAVNTAGGLKNDRYSRTEWFSKFLPVGFYYKAFHTPKRLFPVYEKLMRKAAGLGRINVQARAPVLPKDYDFCELLVVGAGPAGLSAAIAAAEANVDVLVVDEALRPGGSLCYQRQDQAMLIELVERAASLPNLRIRCAAQAAGWYSDHWVAVVDDQRLTKLRAKALLVASGCTDQPAVFRNNDLPGVMLGTAVQRLIRLYAVKPFERAIVLTANDEGYRVALDLADAGVMVAAVIDLRTNAPIVPDQQAVASRKIEILTGHALYEAMADKGRVSGSVVCPFDQDGHPRTSSRRTIACDGIAVCVGWSPNSGILSQSGVRFRYSPHVEQLVPSELPPSVFAAGRVNGIFALEDQLADGRRAGAAAAAFLGRSVSVPPVVEHQGPPPSHPYPIFAHPDKKNFIDFDEDLHLADIVHAHQEGFDSVELLKRYSTVGMGPSQGKISNMNAVRVLAKLNGDSLEKTGTTTSRPVHQPVSIAHLAGRRFHPYRHTSLDAWHRRNGAVMMPVGTWYRPEYYTLGQRSRDDCILDEALNVRRRLGLIDLGTLGKLMVSGPDAVCFLEQIYTCSFAKLKPGSLRYAAAVDETGVLIEEGLVARLAEDRFYLTATTSGSEAFYREMQRWAMIFNMDVTLVNATGQWSAMNLAGQQSREVLAQLTDIDLSSGTFPFAGIREAVVAGAPAIVMRVGFVGELSYEIHLPASKALGVWEALFGVGEQFGVRPFGVEAQRLLRLEKGHLIATHDTDALTNPFEAHLDWAVAMKKPFFVGKRSLEIIRRKPIERKLVGIAFPAGYAGPLPEECQLVIDGNRIIGRVTSISGQTTVGYAIGLAFVLTHMSEPGTKIHIRTCRGQYATAQVVKLPFYDPENARQK